MYQSLLVPVDGSNSARKALELACKLVTGHGVIHLLNVPEPPEATDTLGKAVGAPAMDTSGGETVQAGLELIEQTKQAEQSGQGLIDRLRAASGLVNTEMKTIVQVGNPTRVILEQADKLGVEAIVMGSRGLSDCKGLIIGSVSHKVMHTADCDVILVKHEPDRTTRETG